MIQYFMVIFIGITVIFVLPRIVPTLDPVERSIGQATMKAAIHPEAVKEMRKSLTELYGLKGNIFQQYLRFWGRLLRGDFGPSLSRFPLPVTTLIRNALPWTAGLLIICAIVAWIIGNVVGGLAGYFNQQRWTRFLENIAMSIYPIPYYIMALGMVILLGYLFPIFPITGGISVSRTVSFNLGFLSDLLRHAFLPALSIISIGTGLWFLTMNSLMMRIVEEDYIQYAKAIGLPERKILLQYALRNALPPQVTGLAMQMGRIFSGALVTEYVFSYPGIGQLLYNGIKNADFNLMIGITMFSIIAISTATLIIDLIYPFFDPRIRYR